MAQGVVISLLFLTLSVTGIAMVFPTPFRVARNLVLGVNDWLRPRSQRLEASSIMRRLRIPAELHPNGRSYLAVVPESGDVLEVTRAPEVGLGPIVFDAFYGVYSGKTQ